MSDGATLKRVREKRGDRERPVNGTPFGTGASPRAVLTEIQAMSGRLSSWRGCAHGCLMP
jgi:hypothetical protein